MASTAERWYQLFLCACMEDIHYNGLDFSYDRMKEALPLEHSETRGAHYDSFFLHYDLIEMSLWEVGKVLPKPSLDAWGQGDNRGVLSPFAMWTNISCFSIDVSKSGALVADGHRLYMLRAGLKLAIFEIKQQGIRCTMVSCNNQHDYVILSWSCRSTHRHLPSFPFEN